ncbi:TonB-dependent receptor [uncultured Spirosoma sp.]|uniref:SusC/RagA family TonB-linked outer membrane protein n=1 Tax=uncultured Spirosoma sp. TaxID=278208 RepID=UPI00258555E5|nr:TonB-dependent receptor [uncultured Spirosoma sp.]
MNTPAQQVTQHEPSTYLTIQQVLQSLETKHAIYFMFHTDKVKTVQVLYKPMANESVQKTLDRILKPNGLDYKRHGKIYAIFPAGEGIKLKSTSGLTLPTGNPLSAEMVSVTGSPVTSEETKKPAELTVTGIVKSETGEGMPGVSVVIKNTTRGTTTDVNGKFSLTVPNESTVLVFSFVGYLNQEVTVGKQTALTIQLAPDDKSLDEVVVVGYGTQRKSDISGAVSVITPKEIAQNPSPNLSNSLVGQTAGIIATQRSGEPGNDASNIYIRGIGTTGDASPIYVIDGIVRSSSDFAQLNPSEIQNFSVLKDAASAAVFGVRAGNGVILVTTKRGASGKTQFTYSANFGIQQRTRVPEYLNAYDFASLYNEALANQGKAPLYSQTVLQKYKDQSDPDLYPDSDYLSLLKKTAPISQHNLSVNGGTDKVRYATSLSYLNQQGIVPTNVFKRYNFRSNIDADVTSTTRLSFDLAGRSEQTRNLPNSSSQLFQRIGATPTNRYPLRYTNGYYPNGPSYILLPENGYSKKGVYAFRGRMQVLQQIPFVPGLSVKGIASFDKTLTDSKIWINPTIPFYTYLSDGTYRQEPLAASSLTQDYYDDQAITLETHLNYEKQFGKSKLSGLVLYTQTRQNWSYLRGYRERYTIGIDELDFGAAVNRNNSGYSGSSGRQGVVGRINFSHNEKYSLETSFRADGSEQFAPDKRWGFFPSVSGAWIISQESFLANVKNIDYIKLRGSYGILGNDRLNSARFLYLQSYNVSGNAVFGDGNVQPAIREGNLANPDVTWETVKKLDFGLDATFFNGKLSATIDYFYDKRSNVLGYRNASVPALVGIGLPVENIAKVDNHGIELSLGHTNSFSNGIRYTMNGNLTFARNKVVFIDEPASTNENIKRTGRPLYTEFGFRALGLFQNQAEVDAAPKQIGTTGPGDIRYEDINGDGKIDDNDRVPIGRANTPEIIFGYNGRVNYRNFELSFLFQGATNVNQWYRGEAAWPFFVGAGAMKQNLDRWTPSNPNASEPRVLVDINNMNHYDNSSFWLKDASYVRLKSVELAYTFPREVVGKTFIQGLRVYVNANNVATWSKIKNFDPENGNDRGWGYPQLRIWNAGFNFQF